MSELGVFLPVCNNGYIVSTTAPQYPPSYAMNKAMTLLAEELGMRPLQAHCHRGFGTLYAKTGQREQARAALSTAITLYRTMEMTFWVPQAEAILTEEP